MDHILHANLLDLVCEGKFPELKVAWNALSLEERSAQLAHRHEELGYGVFSMALDQLNEETAKLVVFLIEQGASDPPFKSKEAWNKVHILLSPDINKKITPELSVEVEKVWRSLVDRGIGKVDMEGRHWGPQQIAAQMSCADEDLALSRFSQMKAAGYDLDQKDEIGETALMVAAWSGSPRLFAFLLDEGADLTSKTTGGRDILDFVFRSKEGNSKQERAEEMAQCLEILRERGFPLDEAFERVDEKTMELWRKLYMPAIASKEAGDLAQRAPLASPSRPRNSGRL